MHRLYRYVAYILIGAIQDSVVDIRLVVYFLLFTAQGPAQPRGRTALHTQSMAMW